MLDLSNNNGPVDFRRVFQAGQRRVYLKRSEGTGFTDRTFTSLRSRAHKAGLKVGAYHFAHPHASTPAEEASYFLRLLPRLVAGRDLRPCLDLEHQTSSPTVGRWAAEWIRIVQRELGVKPILYSYASYCEACAFPRPVAPLWLASYGRNDGREHPFTIPRPWRSLVAHQYASTARVAGCSGEVDISHVFSTRALDITTGGKR